MVTTQISFFKPIQESSIPPFTLSNLLTEVKIPSFQTSRNLQKQPPRHPITVSISSPPHHFDHEKLRPAVGSEFDMNARESSLQLLLVSNRFCKFEVQSILAMSKNTMKFLSEAGINPREFRELSGGCPTRTRATYLEIPSKPKFNHKKNLTKAQPQPPPQLRRTKNLETISLQDFELQIKGLFKMGEEKIHSHFSIGCMYAVYRAVAAQGGVIEASSTGDFPRMVKKELNEHREKNEIQDLEAIERLRRILFSLEFTIRNPDADKKLYELGEVNFVPKQELAAHIQNKQHGLKYFNHDLTLFQEGAQGLQFDKSIFCLPHICDHYKHQTIDIRIQNPLDFGFRPHKLKNKPYKMTLGEYRFYQQNYQDPQKMKDFKHADCLKKGQIFFGVNFEPDDEMLNREVKKYVGNTFLDFHGDFDMMSYLDQDVPGCSLPQMYFKTAGCWTGGHQENVSMSALNINHGPDYSEWYTLDLKYVEDLRTELKQEFQMDLYESEGLWYESLDWFISHGYPVKRFLQRKDDIVVTGPGTLHWVRSFGVAIQTSWNLMPKTLEQFVAAFHRHHENKLIKFHRADTIPIKSLIMKYLNHERCTMDRKILTVCVNQLHQWLKEENQALIEIELMTKIPQRAHFYLRDLQSFCTLCKQEVLVYFVAAPKEKKKGIQCLNCFRENYKKTTQLLCLYYKHEYRNMETLITLCRDFRLNYKYPQEIQDLCKGDHVGNIGAPCRHTSKNLQKSEKEQNSMVEEQDIERNNADAIQNLSAISNQKQFKAEQIEKLIAIQLERKKSEIERQSKADVADFMTQTEKKQKRSQSRSGSRSRSKVNKNHHNERQNSYEKRLRNFQERKNQLQVRRGRGRPRGPNYKDRSAHPRRIRGRKNFQNFSPRPITRSNHITISTTNNGKNHITDCQQQRNHPQNSQGMPPPPQPIAE